MLFFLSCMIFFMSFRFWVQFGLPCGQLFLACFPCLKQHYSPPYSLLFCGNFVWDLTSTSFFFSSLCETNFSWTLRRQCCSVLFLSICREQSLFFCFLLVFKNVMASSLKFTGSVLHAYFYWDPLFPFFPVVAILLSFYSKTRSFNM